MIGCDSITLSDSGTIETLRNLCDIRGKKKKIDERIISTAKNLIQNKKLEDIELSDSNGASKKLELQQIVSNIDTEISLSNNGIGVSALEFAPDATRIGVSNTFEGHFIALYANLNIKLLKLITQKNISDKVDEELKRGADHDDFQTKLRAIPQQTITGQNLIFVTYGGGHTISVLLKVDNDGRKEIVLCPSTNMIGSRKKHTDNEIKGQIDTNIHQVQNAMGCSLTQEEIQVSRDNTREELDGRAKFTEKDAIQKIIEDIKPFTDLLQQHGWDVNNAKVAQPCNQWSQVSCAFAAVIGGLRAFFGDLSVQSYYDQDDYEKIVENYLNIATLIVDTHQERKEALYRIYQYAQGRTKHAEIDKNIVDAIEPDNAEKSVKTSNTAQQTEVDGKTISIGSGSEDKNADQSYKESKSSAEDTGGEVAKISLLTTKSDSSIPTIPDAAQSAVQQSASQTQGATPQVAKSNSPTTNPSKNSDDTIEHPETDRQSAVALTAEESDSSIATDQGRCRSKNISATSPTLQPRTKSDKQSLPPSYDDVMKYKSNYSTNHKKSITKYKVGAAVGGSIAVIFAAAAVVCALNASNIIRSDLFDKIDIGSTKMFIGSTVIAAFGGMVVAACIAYALTNNKEDKQYTAKSSSADAPSSKISEPSRVSSCGSEQTTQVS